MKTRKWLKAFAPLVFFHGFAWGNASPKLDAVSLWKYARSHQINTVEDFLRILPPELKNSYAVIFAGRALMQSSPEQPRILLRPPGSEVVLSFNGGGTKPGDNSVEMWQFNQQENKFEFFDLSFPLSNQPPEKNPAKCLACHGSDPHPFWDAYPLWPGMVGSEEGDYPSHPNEAAIYRRLKDPAQTNARYKWLGEMADPGRFHDPVSVFPYDFQGTMGLFMGVEMGELNERRIYRQLSKSPFDIAHNPFRFAMLAYGACNMSNYPTVIDMIKEMIPASEQARFPTKLEDLQKKIVKSNFEQFKERAAREKAASGDLVSPRLISSLNDPTQGGQDGSFGLLYFYLAERYKIDTTEWTMDFDRSPYVITLGFPFEFRQITHMLFNQMVTSHDPDDRALIDEFKKSNHGKLPEFGRVFATLGGPEKPTPSDYCKAAKKMSVQVLSRGVK